jgi:hypothetical protein
MLNPCSATGPRPGFGGSGTCGRRRDWLTGLPKTGPTSELGLGTRLWTRCRTGPNFPRPVAYENIKSTLTTNLPVPDVCYVSVVIELEECSLCFGSFHKSLVRQDVSRCRCQSRMSHLTLAEHAASSAAATTTGDCLGRYHLVFKRASSFEARICIAEASRLRTVLAHPVHGHYLQDWLISVSADHRWTYRNVIIVTDFIVPSGICGFKKTFDCRSPQSICQRPRQSKLRPTAYGSTT